MSDRTKKVLFLLPYPLKHAPSQRFRVELYERHLKEAGISYEFAPFMDVRTWQRLYGSGGSLQKAIGVLKGFLRRKKTILFDVPRFEYVFIHREAAPLGPPVFEWIIAKVFRKKIIFDFDDAIWIPNTTAENKAASFLKAPWKVAKICKWAYRISAGNQYLADFAKRYNDNVVVLPTCVDMTLGHNVTKEHREQKPVVGWTGSHSTLLYLDEVVPVIRELQLRYAFTFMVIANKDPELTLPDYRFVQWNEATEAVDLLQLDIGIMPLTEDRWSEGKCGFKLIQYLALGIPAIASPVGVNKLIIEDGVNGFLVSDATTWTQKLEILLNNSTLRKQMGEEGRKLIAARYSIQANLEQFLKLFS